MAPKGKNKKLKSLSHGRPPTAKPSRAISSKASRTLIRSHHALEKSKAQALAEGNAVLATSLQHQIDAQGGLERYQRASLQGQSHERGGDSSKILMEWLQPLVPALKNHAANDMSLRLLEIGALSVSNACSRSKLFDIERIDLKSQAEGIKQQDFMERPLPKDGSEQFDILSLSLVLNFVPDAAGKGKMLLRTLEFLKEPKYLEDHGEFLPALFLVLPASCVTNSRYMDEAKLEAIMESIGYVNTRKKLSNKLVYYLWRMASSVSRPATSFKKAEVRSGKDRNNFAIVLK
ncbi:25S rRNA (adenine(2142)-N(1))-methyltransferase [Hyphodiscus hymeniophilus]|uniref:25S rRNA adenine-N(1) methyltransferase n=1 Tax=Hyphodiscus hymeniophilus TaxID=353542 RepID=A0A9P6VIE0_9HELO|nr:25S rRNA (adenine(2142)-N(1))-methyltransferase [Hyphodiscus hymeniophilus]